MSQDLPAEDSIRIPVTLTFTEFHRFVLRVKLRQFSWAVQMWTLILFGGLFILGREMEDSILRSTADHWPYLLLGCALLVILLKGFSIGRSYFQLRRTWWSTDLWRTPHLYIFSETGIEILGKNFHVVLSWEAIKQVKRLGSFVCLRTGPQAVYLLPLRAFRDATEWERFRKLVASYVPECWLLSAGSLPLPPRAAADNSETQPAEPAEESVAPAETDPLPALSEEEAIRVHFTPALVDHLRLKLRHFLRVAGLQLLIALAIFAGLLLALPDHNLAGDPQFLLFFGVGTVVWVLFVFLFTFVTVILAWVRHKPVQEPRTFIFADSGIMEEGVTFTDHLSWNLIRKIERRGGLIVLEMATKVPSVVPEKAFTAVDLVRFRRLAEAKVPDCRLG